MIAVGAPAARTPRATLAHAWSRLRQRAFRSAPADLAPVVLRHSRIYILPTRRGYAVIATLITMLLTSLNYALALGLGVTFMFGGLVAAALLHTFRNLAGIAIKPLAASDTFAGGHVVFSLAVSSGAIDRRAISISANDANAKAAIAAGSSPRASPVSLPRRAIASGEAVPRTARKYPTGPATRPELLVTAETLHGSMHAKVACAGCHADTQSTLPHKAKLAAPTCPRVTNEAFLTGTEPLEICALHRW